MSLRMYSIILLIILSSSVTSGILLFYYMNPESDLSLAFALMASAIVLAGSSFLSFVIFFLKKIYYRGEVYTSTMHASVRQAVLIMLGAIGTLGLMVYGLAQMKLIVTLWMVMIIIEIMIQSLE